MYNVDPQLLDLATWRVFEKTSFVPPPPTDPAAGMPPGAPPPGAMDPAAGGMPSMPMDPAAGAPPMDPSMGGMPPDPSAMPPGMPPDPSAGGAPPDIAGMITQAVQAGIAAGNPAASGAGAAPASGSTGSSKGSAKLDPNRLFEELTMTKKLLTGLYQQLGLHLPNDILDGAPPPEEPAAAAPAGGAGDSAPKQASIEVGSPIESSSAKFQRGNNAVAALAERCRGLFTQ